MWERLNGSRLSSNSAGGAGTTGFEGGATPIADCGGYGAGCPAIMIGGGLPQSFM